MAARRETNDGAQTSRRRPATTPDGREKQLISMAADLVEKRMTEGTASAQEIVHLLKLGSSRERLEQERLSHENELTRVKIEAIASQERTEELYRKALSAMATYTGQAPLALEEDYGD